MRRMFLLLVLALTAACETPVATGPDPARNPAPEVAPAKAPAKAPAAAPLTAAERQANRQAFDQVVRAVEPVAEQECRRRTSGVNCDFQIVIDRKPRAVPYAYQTENSRGRPAITFTVTMIDSARSPDELAFVMGHEAAHHIAGHLQRQAQDAAAGAEIYEALASVNGDSAAKVAKARKAGAFVGARSYSQDFELEADRLGAVIAYYAGFDPVVGAQFFNRIPDPGDQFLGTHPPNAARIRAVRETARQLDLVPR